MVYWWTLHYTLEVTWVDEKPTFSFIQTRFDLYNSYVLEGLVQIKFCACENWVYMWSTICVYIRESSWSWSFNSLEPDLPQHGILSPCVITQQYTSTTLISYACLPTRQNIWCTFQKCYCFNFFTFLKILKFEIVLVLEYLNIETLRLCCVIHILYISTEGRPLLTKNVCVAWFI